MTMDAADGVAALVQPGAQPIRLNTQESFAFTEGPVWNHAGSLHFSDGPSNTTRRLKADGTFDVLRSDTRGGNGMALDGTGNLLVCEGAGNRVSLVHLDTLAVETVVDSYGGKPLNAPNDLVLDRAGGFYFTDPVFPAAGQRPVQDVEAVYYFRAGHDLVRVWDGVPKPNGIVLRPDERTLLVADSFGKHIWAIELAAPGVVERAYPWAELDVPPEAYVLGEGGRAVLLEGYPEATLADGMALDVEGRLYIAAQQGVQVVDASGVLLGTLVFPEQPANCAFGGADLRTLYVTAQTSVYSLALQTPGLALPMR